MNKYDHLICGIRIPPHKRKWITPAVPRPKRKKRSKNYFSFSTSCNCNTIFKLQQNSPFIRTSEAIEGTAVDITSEEEVHS